MTATLAVLLGSMVVSVTAPLWLAHLESSRLEPAAVLSCWWSAIAGVIGTVVLALVIAVLPDRGGASALGRLADLCVTALRHANNPRLEELLAIGTAGVLCIALARILILGGRASVRRRQHVRGHLKLLGQIGRTEAQILWIPHASPLAFSIAGRRPVIVATSALNLRLPGEAVDAVLAHEQAHLSARHHLQIALADALAVAIPGVALFARAPTAVRRLVEFAADATAARAHGSDAVVLALGVVAHQDGPPGALAMSGGDLDARMLRLRRPHPSYGRYSSKVAHVVSAAASAALPAAAAVAMIFSVALLACA